MSYKSLLFCPDEKTARVVTQVLSELEFTVELSGQPLATVKKLTDEHFDALVVDCQNEQDASLLFTAARNSNLNHSSLSVAVVEGQAGVAKAFRIGANLVLSKPVNVEQSKNTLRVARGLLRKNSEARASASVAAPAAQPAGASSMSSSKSPSRPFAFEPAASSAGSPAAMSSTIAPAPSAPSAPYSALELEKDPVPVAEPSDAAMLESMPNPIDGKPVPAAEPMWAPRSQGHAQPIAASTGGQGAAVAPALEKPKEVRRTGLSPMVTNEPITAESGATEHFPVDSFPVPTFATLDAKRPALSGSGDGKGWVKTVAVWLILGAAGYLAWQNLQPLQYLPGAPTVQRAKQPAVAPVASPVSTPSVSSTAGTSSVDAISSDAIHSDATPATDAAPDPDTVTISSPTAAAPGVSAGTTSGRIRVQEMPMNSDQKTRLAAKPQPNAAQPIVVKPGTVQARPGSPGAKPAQPTPPPLTLSTANNSSAALSSIISADAAKPTLGSLRISQGVSQGLVRKKVAPVYSATALQLRKEGAVQLMARIVSRSKSKPRLQLTLSCRTSQPPTQGRTLACRPRYNRKIPSR